MKRKILTLAAALWITLFPPLMVAAPAYATCPGANDNSSKDVVLKSIGTTGNDCDAGGVTNVIKTVVQILSYIVGIVAIIMIIVSGIRYILSGGDSAKVSAAKNSLLYALVGLAVAALAQFLVRFVLYQSGKV